MTHETRQRFGELQAEKIRLTNALRAARRVMMDAEADIIEAKLDAVKQQINDIKFAADRELVLKAAA
jgi:hypothetical protein